ncbi:Adenylate kinase isoenzyme 5 [Toxocara canis]|uniref:Adenylate kinase isoenzyme 5 n=1 Tax=Toxocara canis TaxID=6265 RepID=A0A0B2VYL4_TOXCA|nr:Adenylate kinase isoenzyme 5 [Toxocara canis]
MKGTNKYNRPDVPIILFMGGPGGGKTRHAERVRDALADSGLVHICMPDMIRNAIAKYKERYPEWKEAAIKYHRGELIPNNLALALVKAEMGRHQDAKAFFLEGFPREARQVEDFEREVRPVNMALILDYDEATLRKHMENRGLDIEMIDARIREFKQKTLPSAKYFDDQRLLHLVRPVNMALILDYDEATLRKHMENRGLDIEMIDARIREFKQKTLPSAKYFDDQRLLHLIPGEKDDQTIYERMKMLVQRAMDAGVPVLNSASSSQQTTPKPPESSHVSAAAVAAATTAAAATVAAVSEEAQRFKATSQNNVSHPPTHASRPPTHASRPPTRASRPSRPPSSGSRHSQPSEIAASQPPGTAASGDNHKSSSQSATPPQKPNSENTSRKGTPVSGSPVSKPPSIPATPPKTAMSQHEQVGAKSATPLSNHADEERESQLADANSTAVLAAEAPPELEQGQETKAESPAIPSAGNLKEEPPPIANSPAITAAELHESSPVQTATIESIAEAQPILATPIAIPPTVTSQNSNPHSTIVAANEETKSSDQRSNNSEEAVEAAEVHSKRATPATPGTPASIKSKVSEKSNKSFASNKSVTSNKSIKSIGSNKSVKSINSNTSKKAANEGKPETPKSEANPTMANAVEVPVEVHSPAEKAEVKEEEEEMEEEEEEEEEKEEKGGGKNDEASPMRSDSKISSTASTPGPASSIAAQLTSTIASDAASAKLSPSRNDTFPHGLPNNAPVVLVIGAPGSNKAAIAQRIAKKYDGFVYLSMGELLRRQVVQNPDDELWQRIGKKMNAGETVPMKICRELLYSCIHDVGGRSWGYVIEGYPRTQAQAVDFENQFERLDLAILIDCTEQFCFDSIKKRVEAAKVNNDARPDDSPEVVNIRLAMFKQNTLPMLKYLDDKGKLRVVRFKKAVDGDLDVDKIFVEVTSAIDNTIFIEDQESGKSLTSSKDGSTDGRDHQDI